MAKRITIEEKRKKMKAAITFMHQVKELDVALTIRHLSIMLKSGMALEDALEVLVEQTTDPFLFKALDGALSDIRTGKTLTEALTKHKKIFSPIILSIIDVGEQGGTLETSLLFLSEYLKKAHELSKKVKGALIYPMIVLALTVVEMLGMMLFILPKMESLFSSFSNVPPFTLFIMGISKFLLTNGHYVALGLLVFGIILKMFLGTEIGIKFKSAFSLNFPVIKNLTKSNLLTTITRTLGILLESGLPLSKAIEITASTVPNDQYKKVLDQVNTNVKQGQNIFETLSDYPQYFDVNFIKMIEVGENTGTLEENLDFLFDFYSEEVEDMSNNLTTLLEPIMLIFVGAMIGVLAIIIIGPIYQLTGTIRDA